MAPPYPSARARRQALADPADVLGPLATIDARIGFAPAAGWEWECRIDHLTPDAPPLRAALDSTGLSDARARAAWFIHGYGWRLAVAPVAAYMLRRRVIDLAVDNLSLVGNSGGRWAIRLHDPSRGWGPDERVWRPNRRSAACLRSRFWSTMEQHFGVFLALADLRQLNPAARWRLAGDAVAEAALFAGQALFPTDVAVRVTADLLGDAGRRPGTLPRSPCPPDGDGRHLHWRASCCLAHRVGDPRHDRCPDGSGAPGGSGG